MSKRSSNTPVNLTANEPQPEVVPAISLPGYAVSHSPGGERVLVPHFMVPDATMKMEAKKQQHELNVAAQAGGPLPQTHIPYIALATGSLYLPADPPITNWEALKVHADIATLQEVHGISYKDASSWIYLSTLEGLRADDGALKEIACIQQEIQQLIVTEIYHPLLHIDNYHILKSVGWQGQQARAAPYQKDQHSDGEEREEMDKQQQYNEAEEDHCSTE